MQLALPVLRVPLVQQAPLDLRAMLDLPGQLDRRDLPA